MVWLLGARYIRLAERGELSRCRARNAAVHKVDEFHDAFRVLERGEHRVPKHEVRDLHLGCVAMFARTRLRLKVIIRHNKRDNIKKGVCLHVLCVYVNKTQTHLNNAKPSMKKASKMILEKRNFKLQRHL